MSNPIEPPVLTELTFMILLRTIDKTQFYTLLALSVHWSKYPNDTIKGYFNIAKKTNPGKYAIIQFGQWIDLLRKDELVHSVVDDENNIGYEITPLGKEFVKWVMRNRPYIDFAGE